MRHFKVVMRAVAPYWIEWAILRNRDLGSTTPIGSQTLMVLVVHDSYFSNKTHGTQRECHPLTLVFGLAFFKSKRSKRIDNKTRLQ